MENNGMQHTHGDGQHCDSCCGMGGGMWNKRHMGYMVVKIFVALFIFWAGVQFGELKAIIHSGYSVHDSGVYNVRGGMMSGWSY